MKKTIADKLDPFTFGDSKAALTLVKILEESKSSKALSKVSRYWNQYTFCARKLSESNLDKEMFIKMIKMLTKEHLSRLETFDFGIENPKVKSFLRNIIETKKKKFINKRYS
jgi:hypothetical protein